jgi:hypothetical protein
MGGEKMLHSGRVHFGEMETVVCRLGLLDLAGAGQEGEQPLEAKSW